MGACATSDTRAATSVVGVILIVAVTILLAAVFATFALDIGEGVQDNAPVGSFDYTYSDKNNKVTVTFASGDPLDGSQLRFGGAATEKTSYGSITEWTGGTVEAGDSAGVEVTSDQTLRVLWQANGSDTTAILSTYEVPNDPSATASIGSVDTSDTKRNSGNGDICVYNVDFSNAWGSSVYIQAVYNSSPTRDSAVLTTSGGSVKLNVNPNNVGGNNIVVTVYETKAKNNALDSVTSSPGWNSPGCSV